MENNIAGWFEIPVQNMDRAVAFYEEVFQFKMQRNKLGELEMAWFPFSVDGKGAAGSLVYHPDFYKPSAHGTLVYLSCEDVANESSRIEKAGGKILQPKKAISPEHGFMALFIDSEGNRVALHSAK
jgi:predicted enzyme related to lactoylglutathione lyase